MKKFITAFLLILPISAFAEDFGTKFPQWEDFAPKAYVNVKEPKGVGKLNVIASYWYQRKVNFETELDACKSIETNNEQFNCLEELKVKQYQENTNYNARMEAQQQGYAIQEMNNMQGTMLPLNSYLQNIGRFQPNEFR